LHTDTRETLRRRRRDLLLDRAQMIMGAVGIGPTAFGQGKLPIFKKRDQLRVIAAVLGEDGAGPKKGSGSDNDAWSYAYMKGWCANERVPFDFRDAHDLTPMTRRAQDEQYVKSQLRQRLQKSAAAIVLVGVSTRNLYRFVRWEIEVAKELDLPIIVANLNHNRARDDELCPPILRDWCAVHVAFKMKIIRHALDAWPAQFRNLAPAERASGWHYYGEDVYRSLGL
jgi:MTH538 TIR-like domain (DUF1863)